ncbi:hypothetical protein Q7P37_004492 [Cladosporium fusiforme]
MRGARMRKFRVQNETYSAGGPAEGLTSLARRVSFRARMGGREVSKSGTRASPLGSREATHRHGQHTRSGSSATDPPGGPAEGGRKSEKAASVLAAGGMAASRRGDCQRQHALQTTVTNTWPDCVWDAHRRAWPAPKAGSEARARKQGNAGRAVVGDFGCLFPGETASIYTRRLPPRLLPRANPAAARALGALDGPAAPASGKTLASPGLCAGTDDIREVAEQAVRTLLCARPRDVTSVTFIASRGGRRWPIADGTGACPSELLCDDRLSERRGMHPPGRRRDVQRPPLDQASTVCTGVAWVAAVMGVARRDAGGAREGILGQDSSVTVEAHVWADSRLAQQLEASGAWEGACAIATERTQQSGYGGRGGRDGQNGSTAAPKPSGLEATDKCHARHALLTADRSKAQQ